MNLRLVAKVSGSLLLLLAAFMAVPTLYSLYFEHQSRFAFFFTFATTVIIGAPLILTNSSGKAPPDIRSSLLIVSGIWAAAGFIGAAPYYLSGACDNYIDALFESVSGFTTTGASIFADVESLDSSILLWRAMTQWIGGIGIVVISLILLPLLGIQGAILFKAESSGPDKDKITPRISQTAKRLSLVYFAFTLLIVLGMMGCGTTFFDALLHSMSAISSGGFSNYNSGVLGLANTAAEWILIIGMLFSGISFGLHYRILVRKEWAVFSNQELRLYLFLTIAASIIIFAENFSAGILSVSDNIRLSLFHVISTISSTGYSNVDYCQWSSLSQAVLLVLMIVGGMGGSTAGGIKCIRLLIAIRHLGAEITRHLHPHALIAIKIDRKPIAPHIKDAVWGFLVAYFLCSVISVIILSDCGLPLDAAISATISALSNIGPALGELGPAQNYSGISDIAKLMLAACMILGRLEFFTLMAIFSRAFWKG